MTTPKDLPKELRKLWKLQYEPREKILIKNMKPKTKKMYSKLSYVRKLMLIDDLQSKSRFK